MGVSDLCLWVGDLGGQGFLAWLPAEQPLLVGRAEPS